MTRRQSIIRDLRIFLLGASGAILWIAGEDTDPAWRGAAVLYVFGGFLWDIASAWDSRDHSS